MYDDIYTIQVSVTDRAGRTSDASMGSAVFSVNRFGSTFMLTSPSQFTATDTGSYILSGHSRLPAVR